MDDNTLTNIEETQEQPQAPEVPVVPAPPIESRFLFVDVAALRAKQLRRGARVRLEGYVPGEPGPDTPRKPERVAMEEVRRGLVNYQLAEIEAVEGEEQ